MNDDKPPQGVPPVPPDGIQPGPPPPPLPEQIQVGLPPLPGQTLEPPIRTQSTLVPSAPQQRPGPGDMKDGTREIVETIVFVVVLVLLLKTFVAEAFVIPTGSMATTLLGYHFDVTCEKCGYRFLVNASSEADPQGAPERVTRCRCPNCHYLNMLRRPPLAREGEEP